jgi:hypothetical protein
MEMTDDHAQLHPQNRWYYCGENQTATGFWLSSVHQHLDARRRTKILARQKLHHEKYKDGRQMDLNI